MTRPGTGSGNDTGYSANFVIEGSGLRGRLGGGKGDQRRIIHFPRVERRAVVLLEAAVFLGGKQHQPQVEIALS